MSAKPRPVRIDITQDLPKRARPLSAHDISAIFGGCKGEWITCSQNAECCSFKCRKAWWISSESRWTYECLPTWATS